MEARREGIEDGNSGLSIDSDAETTRWVNAIAFTWLLISVVVIAGLYLRLASGKADQACFERKMNEEHALMEAFFQNPTEQNAVAQAIHACSR